MKKVRLVLLVLVVLIIAAGISAFVPENGLPKGVPAYARTSTSIDRYEWPEPTSTPNPNEGPREPTRRPTRVVNTPNPNYYITSTPNPNMSP